MSTAVAPAPGRSVSGMLAALLRRPDFSVVLATVVLFVIFSIRS